MKMCKKNGWQWRRRRQRRRRQQQQQQQQQQQLKYIYGKICVAQIMEFVL
jgi:hypothetical protein